MHLPGGKNIETALSDMKNNTKNSLIKNSIDSWFQGRLIPYFTNLGLNYNDYLEDTVWCNDRALPDSSGFNPNGGTYSALTKFNSYYRLGNYTPTLDCPEKGDSFTVNDTIKGNGKLTYPVGLLTMDEIIFAGGQNKNNFSYYLYADNNFWTMTPSNFESWITSFYYVYAHGILITEWIYQSHNVRPSIALKPSVKVAYGGDGSATTPYEFVVK